MWLLPSRGRPANLARFFDAYRKTGGATPGLVLISTPDLVNYQGLALPIGWHIFPTEGETQGEKIAECWEQIKDCAWLGLIGDDCVPQTQHWDRGLIERLDGANIVSCDDGWLAPRRLGNCWVMAGALVRAIGYIFPPGLQHLFVDDVWETIGAQAACWSCRMDIVVAHRHVLKGEAPPDQTHRLVYGSDQSDTSGGLWPADIAAYQAWAEGDAARAIAAAKALRPMVHEQTRSEDEGELEIDSATLQRLEYARQRSVMILTPIARNPSWHYTIAFAETCVMLEKLRIRYASRFIVGSSNIPKARNTLAARFLATPGFTDAIYIDDDMGWSANSVLRLLASDKPVIAGVGRKKVDKPNSDPNVWCCHFDASAAEGLVQDEMGAIRLPRVGTGFIKIAREVFERMIAAHPDWKREGDPEMEAAVKANYYRFFKFDDETELGEDYYFCERWRELGGEVWIDPSIVLSHVGEKAWTGKIAEIMEAAPGGPEPLDLKPSACLQAAA